MINLFIKFRIWNKKRRKQQRFTNFLTQEPKFRPSIPRPHKITNLLFIEAQKGWGDFLYANGFLHELKNLNIKIDVVSLPETFQRYKNLSYISNSLSLTSPLSLDFIKSQNYDCALDVTYVNYNYWELRRKILSNLHCHTITTGDLVSYSKLFDEHIDISVYNHWAKRYALIYNTMFQPQHQIDSIKPFYEESNISYQAQTYCRSLNNHIKYIYINTIGATSDRTLSEEQIQDLANLFNERKQSVAIFYTANPLIETPWVKNLPKCNFDDFIYILKRMDAIISPDTSVIHIASALNKPVFGIYCGNNREYWPSYSMQEVWAPLSNHSFVYVEDDYKSSDYTEEMPYFYPKKPISNYSVKIIRGHICSFLQSLGA